MSASMFHRNHDLHKSISEKMIVEVKKTGQDVLKQISNLDQKISDQILPKVANTIVGGIFPIIPNLQEIVIKSNSEEKSSADLKDVVKKLSEYCNQVVQEYNSDSMAIREQFKTFVSNILHEAEALLNIIKRDDLHDFKQEFEDYLKEMLYTIHIGQVRIQIETYTQQEIKDLAESIQKECNEDISIIEHCNPEVLKSVAIQLKFTAKYALNYAYRVNKAASNYHDIEIQNTLIESVNMMHRAISLLLLGSEKITNIKEAIELFITFCVNAWNSCVRLFHFFDIGLENKQDVENLKNFIKWAASYGFVVHKQAAETIRHATSLA